MFKNANHYAIKRCHFWFVFIYFVRTHLSKIIMDDPIRFILGIFFNSQLTTFNMSWFKQTKLRSSFYLEMLNITRTSTRWSFWIMKMRKFITNHVNCTLLTIISLHSIDDLQLTFFYCWISSYFLIRLVSYFLFFNEICCSPKLYNFFSIDAHSITLTADESVGSRFKLILNTELRRQQSKRRERTKKTVRIAPRLEAN